MYGGTIGDSASMISRDSAAGKVVVFAFSTVPGSPRILRGAARFAPNAAAIVLISPDMFLNYMRRPSTFVDDPANAPRAGVPLVLVNAAGAAKLFATAVAGLTAGAAGGVRGQGLASQARTRRRLLTA